MIASDSRQRADVAVLQRHRVGGKSAEAGAAAADRVAIPAEVGETADQPADRDPPFHARERHAGADMDAGGESEMAVRRPGDVETVRFGELVRVPVGGADAAYTQAERRW